MATNDKIKNMSKIQTTTKKLNKKLEEELGLSEITKLGLFPGAKDLKTIRSIVQKDMDGKNLLKVKISGKGQSTRYAIKAKNIVKFLALYGPGMEFGS